VLAPAPLPGTFGERKVLVILLTFLNSSATALPSPSVAQSTMFGTGSSVSNFFRESSYQQAWLTGTVIGPLPIAMTGAGCNYNLLASLADEAARSVAGVNPLLYQHIVYQFPRNGCSWAGLGSLGGLPGRAWINGDLGDLGKKVVSHELGHNLGLHHSHALECGAVSVGGGCSSIEYGDPFDVMGGGSGPTHFNAVQKALLGWLGHGASPPITDVLASGTYPIGPLEVPGTDAKALRVRTKLGDWYYVEHRRAVGFDSYLSAYPNVVNGVLIHYFDGGGDGVYLLDMTPATSTWFDPALTVGATFHDTAGGVSIAPVWVNGTGAGVNITVAGGGNGCVPAAPTLTLMPAQQQGPPGSMLIYSISVRNNGTGCGSTPFTVQATVPSGWTGALAPASLTIADGATGSTELRVTSPATSPAGSYALTVSSAQMGVQGSATAQYHVGDVSGTPGSFADGFDRPDATALGNGWISSGGGLTIVAGQARNEPTKVLHVAVQPAVSGTSQAVETTFTSETNTVGPRFGLVLRYAAPGNYYLCYRQAGATSAVRISKVVNGVETVLKSSSVPNPPKGAPFTLSCQVQGNALTVALNGAPKVSVTDATFVGGSVGFVMGGNPGGKVPHRADNFRATVQ
jgi:hypothetical protein